MRAAAAALPLPPSPPCNPSRRVIEIFTWRGVAFINLVLVVYGLILVGFTSAMGVVQIVKLRKEVGGCFNQVGAGPASCLSACAELRVLQRGALAATCRSVKVALRCRQSRWLRGELTAWQA